MLSELLFASPTSPSNLEAAARYATTLSRLRKAGEQGDAEAQYELGVMYREGQGVAKNEVEAAYWLRKAAGRGIAKAEDSLAAIEIHGPGTAPR